MGLVYHVTAFPPVLFITVLIVYNSINCLLQYYQLDKILPKKHDVSKTIHFYLV